MKSSSAYLSSVFNSSYVIALLGTFGVKSIFSVTKGIFNDLSCFNNCSEIPFSTFNSKYIRNIGSFDYTSTVSYRSFIIPLFKSKSSFFNINNGCIDIIQNKCNLNQPFDLRRSNKFSSSLNSNMSISSSKVSSIFDNEFPTTPLVTDVLAMSLCTCPFISLAGVVF